MSTASRSLPWRRIDDARPLVAWEQAQLAALARLLDGVQQAWRAHWGLLEAPGTAACVCAGERDLAGAWQFAGAAGAGAAGAGAAGAAAVWIARASSFDDDLACALWGDGPVGPVATRIAVACGADLQTRLRAALHVELGTAPAPALPKACGAWAGVVCATPVTGVRLLLDAAAVEQALRSCATDLVRRALPATAGDRLAPVTSALAGVRLPLRARLADCELDLASLQDLRIGDVVRVPHRLDAPLLVRDAREEVVFAGYLARQGRRKALELARAPTTPPH